jgi:transcriptional regulator with XRE-family HTH domain
MSAEMPSLRALGGSPASFSRALRAWRLAAGLSQNQLAREAGCDPAYTNRLERQQGAGGVQPSRQIVLRLAAALAEASGGLADTQLLRDELLVLAGYCPEPVLEAGSLQAFALAVRRAARADLVTLIERLEEVAEPVAARPGTRGASMARAPKYLISIGGEAWVDPQDVSGIDASFDEDDPPWANVRVLLRSGLVLFGQRTPERVAHAVRHPELEHEAEEATEAFPDPQALAPQRARTRRVRSLPFPPRRQPVEEESDG